MQLFGTYTSPFVRHVRIAMAECHTRYDLIETDAKSSAEQSPAMKVPFLRDGGIELTDSTSILRYVREQAGQSFLPSVAGLDFYCLVNTLMDSAINLFLLERNGLDTGGNPYFDRQRARIVAGLKYMNESPQLASLDRDARLRLQCFLYWGVFRNRFDIAPFEQLGKELDKANADSVFAETAPPAGS